MQVATDGAEFAPAVVTPTSKRFYSAEAAAKHWATNWGVVSRPGGYLHTTHETYPTLPEFVLGPEGTLAHSVDRLYDHQYNCGVKGYTELAVILCREELMYTQTGPRGATQYYLREEDRRV